ncbi:LacI family DNA-binding transcriptional regulator [Domibacillus sp. DTU_2020_1001157_1_SI_ALB_TIR_016]|uniref:LacI family DNA-binding transcriptional regulator n=1 Tax=Domibacillus sp. DTU_2020_1001157_1_SI_ALB_TIR_016 TaxID=3077789 RepID=UPI0028E8F479|nr:LacI family DNA-binding transcriptional regulator [Domibacillus sp. DTU_2020_1001157_1_SI_ALB_TIR_016]WNS78933.1 LacI family DNA-binding transcriptional regulator [Domibacillus sp. DTU_2020_1001157_1_SI_ALB_TIR_016]
MKPKIKDVAERAGVSPATVSRVLNNRGYLSEQTRLKVGEAVMELNYIPNDLARSLYTKKTNLIGFVFPSTANAFYGELIALMENICFELGYKVLLCNSSNHPKKEELYVDMLLRNQVDGIISGAHNRGIKDYQRSNLPVVGIDRYLSKSIPVVSSDNYQGGRLATELLVQKSCTSIIHINGPRELETPANKRRDAYEDVLKKAGMPHLTYEILARSSEEQVQLLIKRLFDENPEVDGIFASDDHLAARVLTEAKRRKISVPERLKIIGYDGTESMRTILPELTTIQQPLHAMAQKAVHTLIQEIEGQYNLAGTKEFVFPVKLIEGKTT